jgi:TIGR03009 family protein
MNRFRGRILGQIWQKGLLAACLFTSGVALAQQADQQQHWTATQNYPTNNGPNYQPQAGGGAPAATAPTNGSYQYPQQPQPANSQSPNGQQYPPADGRPAPAGQPYGPQGQPDNRQPNWRQPDYGQQNPQYLAQPGTGQPGQIPTGSAPPGMGPIQPGETIHGPTTQGLPAQPNTPQVPFLLSQPEINALNNLLTDWEKRNKEIHLMESKFFRWKYDTVFGNASQPPPYDEGELKFAAPDKAWMHIKGKDPKQSEQWLCDGKSVFHWDYNNSVVTEYLMPREMQGKGIGDGPLPFVFGIEAQKLKQRYYLRIITPANVHNEVWLEAYPKWQQDANNYYKVEVILQIVGEDHTLFPYAIQIYATNKKDRIVYQLQSPQINPRSGVFGTGLFAPDPWKPNIPITWKRKTELPQPEAPQTGANPATPQRR